jgi:hypothetical protein
MAGLNPLLLVPGSGAGVKVGQNYWMQVTSGQPRYSGNSRETSGHIGGPLDSHKQENA